MTTIITKNGSGAPAAGQLSQGELAVDLTNKELYTKDSGGNVIKVGAQGGSTGTFTDLTATSSFTSPGIDDNANATAITINSSGSTDYTNNITVTGSGKQIIVDDTGTNDVQAYMTAAGTAGGFVASRGAPNDSEVRLEAKGNVGSLKMTGLAGLSTEIQSNSGGNLVFNMDGTQRATLSQSGTFTAERLVANANMKVEGAYPALDMIDTDATLGLGTRMVQTGDTFLMNALNSAGSYIEDIYKVNMNANGPTLHSWTTESAGTAMALSNGGTLGLGVTIPNNAGLVELQANAGNGKSGSGLLMLTNTESTSASITFNTPGNDYSIGSSGSNIFNVYDITNASTPFAIDANTPSSTLRLSSSGRVGIGTISPSYNLDVTGDARFTGGGSGSVVINDEDSSLCPTMTFTRNGGGTTTNDFIRFENSAGVAASINSKGGAYFGDTLAVGTTSASAILHTKSPATAGGNLAYFDDSGSGSTGRFQITTDGGSGADGMRISCVNRARIQLGSAVDDGLTVLTSGTDVGNVGIGTTSPSYKLHVEDNPTTTGAPQVAINSGVGGVDGVLAFPLAGDSKGSIISNKPITFHTGALTNTTNERMRIDSSGNFLVGKTSAALTLAGCRIQPTGDIRISKTGSTADTMIGFYKDGSGTSVGRIESTSTTTDYVTTSDERLKDNIVDAPAGNIDSIKVRSFDWKADGSHQEYGFIAQELETVAPYAVSKGETDEDTWGVDYSKLVPMLVKEIQDLKAEVAALKGA